MKNRDTRRVYNKAVKKINAVKKKIRKPTSKGKVKQFKPFGDSKQYETESASRFELIQDPAISVGGHISFDTGKQGDFVIRWGKIFHQAGTSNQPNVYTFKKPFVKRCFGVILNMQRSGTKSANASNITKFGFEVDSDNDLASDRFINYIAIGY